MALNRKTNNYAFTNNTKLYRNLLSQGFALPAFETSAVTSQLLNLGLERKLWLPKQRQLNYIQLHSAQTQTVVNQTLIEVLEDVSKASVKHGLLLKHLKDAMVDVPWAVAVIHCFKPKHKLFTTPFHTDSNGSNRKQQFSKRTVHTLATVKTKPRHTFMEQRLMSWKVANLGQYGTRCSSYGKQRFNFMKATDSTTGKTSMKLQPIAAQALVPKPRERESHSTRLPAIPHPHSITSQQSIVSHRYGNCVVCNRRHLAPGQIKRQAVDGEYYKHMVNWTSLPPTQLYKYSPTSDLFLPITSREEEQHGPCNQFVLLHGEDACSLLDKTKPELNIVFDAIGQHANEQAYWQRLTIKRLLKLNPIAHKQASMKRYYFKQRTLTLKLLKRKQLMGSGSIRIEERRKAKQMRKALLAEKRIIPSYRDNELTVAKRAFGVTSWAKLMNKDLDIFWSTDRSVTDAFRNSELPGNTHPNPAPLLAEVCQPSQGESNQLRDEANSVYELTTTHLKNQVENSKQMLVDVKDKAAHTNESVSTKASLQDWNEEQRYYDTESNRAVIDWTGRVKHGDACPCADSDMTVAILCQCTYIDQRLPFQTSDSDYFIQFIRAAQATERQGFFSFYRDSQLVDSSRRDLLPKLMGSIHEIVIKQTADFVQVPQRESDVDWATVKTQLLQDLYGFLFIILDGNESDQTHAEGESAQPTSYNRSAAKEVDQVFNRLIFQEKSAQQFDVYALQDITEEPCQKAGDNAPASKTIIDSKEDANQNEEDEADLTLEQMHALMEKITERLAIQKKAKKQKQSMHAQSPNLQASLSGVKHVSDSKSQQSKTSSIHPLIQNEEDVQPCRSSDQDELTLIQDSYLDELLVNVQEFVEYGVFHPNVHVVELQKPVSLRKRKQRVRYETLPMLSVQLNLQFSVSHPQLRNLLKTVKHLVGVLGYARLKMMKNTSLKAKIKSIGVAQLREYFTQVNKLFLYERLYSVLKMKAQRLLERLLTEYIHTLSWEKELNCDYQYPVALHFGDLLPHHFVCASGDQYAKHLSKERPGLEGMTDLLKQFAMFLKLQSIIEDSLDCFLSRFQKQYEAQVLRDQFLRTTRLASKRQLVADIKRLNCKQNKQTIKLQAGATSFEEMEMLNALVPPFSQAKSLSKAIIRLCDKPETLNKTWLKLTGLSNLRKARDGEQQRRENELINVLLNQVLDALLLPFEAIDERQVQWAEEDSANARLKVIQEEERERQSYFRKPEGRTGLKGTVKPLASRQNEQSKSTLLKTEERIQDPLIDVFSGGSSSSTARLLTSHVQYSRRQAIEQEMAHNKQ